MSIRKKKKSVPVRANTTPWQFPDGVPQLPKYGYDRPANLPPPAPDIYSPNVGDLKERPNARRVGSKRQKVQDR